MVAFISRAKVIKKGYASDMEFRLNGRHRAKQRVNCRGKSFVDK